MEESIKAWEVYANNIIEPFYYSDIIVYAEDGNKAKAIVWKNNIQNIVEARVKCFKSWRDERNIKYTDLRVSRRRNEDRVEYDGKIVTKEEVEKLEWCKTRTEYAKYLMDNFPDKQVVVRKGSSYWGRDKCGYSDSIIYAGLYSTKEGYEIVYDSSWGRSERVELCDPSIINAEIDKEVDCAQKNIDWFNKQRR